MSKFDPVKLKKLKIIDDLFRLLYQKRKVELSLPLEKKDIKTIVVMAMMMIGDTIMLIPSLRVIKRNFPGANVILLCRPVVKAILEDQDIVSEFVVVQSPWLSNTRSIDSLFSLLKRIKTLKKIKIDLSIDFRGDWRNIFLMSFIKATRSVSFNYSGGEYMLTDIVPQHPTIKHYIDEWLYLLESIGCKIAEKDKYPVLNLTNTEREHLAGFIEKNHLANRFTIGLHAGASLISRRWPADRYAELMLRFSKTYKNCTFVLFEGPGERGTTKELTNTLNDNSVKYVVVNVPLKKYLTLINSCKLLICNDSGAGHIAGAFGIPTFVIYGKADVETVKPYSKNLVRTISHRKNSLNGQVAVNINDNQHYLESITVDEVYNIISQAVNTLSFNKVY